MKRFIPFLFIVGVVFSVQGSVWYVTNNAATGANGSITNPWSISTALKATGSVQPGDTIYLRGGDYVGPGIFSSISGSSNNYVTVQSYSNEWAIITDGTPHIIQTTFKSDPVNNNSVVITGYPTLHAGQVIGVDGEQFYLVYGSGTNWVIVGGWNGTTPTTHSAGTPIYLNNSFIEHTGSYVIFRDFEITASGATNRVVGLGTSNSLGGGLDLQSVGHGNKAVNLIIHNVGHPGIGFWQQGSGGEINGCIMWGNGMYDNAGSWIRGDGVYAENTAGDVYLKNNIAFDNFTTGLKAYGTTIPVVGFHLIDDLVFGNPEEALQDDDQNMFTSNNWLVGNWMMGTPFLSYTSAGNTQQYFYSNTIVNGGFVVNETANSVYTNNTVFMTRNRFGDGAVPVQYRSSSINKSNLNVIWDYNTYYIGNGDSSYQWIFQSADLRNTYNSLGGGNEIFANDNGKAWQNWSGFDAHSVCVTNWPTNYLSVHAQQLDYDSNRWYIVVVSTSGQTGTTFDLSTLGFTQGQPYSLVDAQNYPVPIAVGNYSGPITLPLNLTTIASIPGVTNFVVQHTDVSYPGLFNAFVLRRLATPSPPTKFQIVAH